MKVFISSTSKDLAEHRPAAIKAVTRAQHSLIAMEFFGSVSGSGQSVSLAEIGKADCFIGIYARRYGYRPDGGKSVTEQEYDEAVRLGIPRLIFKVKDDYRHPLFEEHMDVDPVSRQMLADLMKRIDSDNVHSLFTTPDNLEMLVYQALINLAAQQLPVQDKAQTIIHASNFSGGVGNIVNAAQVYYGNVSLEKPPEDSPKKRRPQG